MFGDDGTVVTRQQLADCKEVFDGKCPVVLGHKLADWMPRFGNVAKVELAEGGDSLVGEIEEHDLLKDAREAGFYSDLSVGIKKRAADGKHYLHHTAYLGAVPPKIRDLQIFADVGVVYCADAPGAMVEYSTKPVSAEDRNLAISRITEARRRAWSIDDAKTALDRLSAWAAEMALTGAIPEELLAQVQQFSDQIPEASKEDEVDDKLKKENERLTKELADSNAARLLTAKQGLVKSMDGRVPKGKQNLVLALADAVAGNESIELADDDGKKEKVSGLEILKRVLEVIPKPVTPGKSDLGDDPSEPGKPVDMTKLMSRV